MKTVSDYRSSNLNLQSLTRQRNHGSKVLSIIHHSNTIPNELSLKKRESEPREEISATDQFQVCGKSEESCETEQSTMTRLVWSILPFLMNLLDC